MTNEPDERSPLLQNGHAEDQQDEPEVQLKTKISHNPPSNQNPDHRLL